MDTNGVVLEQHAPDGATAPTISIAAYETVGELYDADDPQLGRTAFQQVWEVFSGDVGGERVVPLSESPDPRIRRKYRDLDPSLRYYPAFAKNFYGLDRELAEIGRVIDEGSKGGEARHRIVWVYGGTGVGKTTLLEEIPEIMEDRGMFFYTIKGCPSHCSWLWALPKAERTEWHRKYHHFDGKLCRICTRLQDTKLHGDWRKLPVEQMRYRLHAGIGAIVYEFSLPDMVTGAKIPNEYYPILYAANNGILVINLEKQPKTFVSFLRQLATDRKVIAEDGFSRISLDIVIIAIGNDDPEEWCKSDPALRSRICPVQVLPPLDWRAELAMLRKLGRERKTESHFQPHVEDLFAKLMVGTRMNLEGGIEFPQIVDVYAGEEVLDEKTWQMVSYSCGEVRQRSAGDQNGKFGVFPRHSITIHDLCLSQGDCITIEDILRTSRTELGEAGSSDLLITPAVKKRIEVLLGPKSEKDAPGKIETLYRKLLEWDLVRASIGIKASHDNEKREFDEYLLHVSAWSREVPVEIKSQGRLISSIPVDKKFLEDVESYIPNISQTGFVAFRNSVVSVAFRVEKDRGADTVRPEDLPRLYLGIRNKMAATQRVLLATLLKQVFEGGMIKSEKDLHQRLLANLRELGYQDCCQEPALRYAQKHIFTP